MTIDDEFGCLGFFGFGTGVSIARDKGSAYCNGCPKRQACWEMHRARVREMFPDLAAKIDELGAQKDGNKKIMQFIQSGGVEPYVNVMTGNMQDGAQVVATGKVKDRGPFTLDYPFKEKTNESSKN